MLHFISRGDTDTVAVSCDTGHHVAVPDVILSRNELNDGLGTEDVSLPPFL